MRRLHPAGTWILAASLLFSSWAVPRVARAHDGQEVGGGDGGDQSSVVSAAPCENGLAAGYPCQNVDLLAFLPLTHLGGATNANDIWGWTDPVTGIEYALVGLSNGTAFVELSDPTQPVYLGLLPTETTDSVWRDIKVFGNYAFIVSEAQMHGMQVFDLTQLRAVSTPPVTFATTANYGGFANSHNLVINEASGYAYAVGTNTCSGGLHMIDIHDPLHPAFAGCFSADGYTHDAQCVNYAGPDAAYQGRELCFAANEDTLTIVDVTDKSAPVQVARQTYAGVGYAHQGWLTADQQYFLLDDELDELNEHHNTRTYVWDVRNLAAPTLVGQYTASTGAIDHNQYIRQFAFGEYAFQANYRAGLRIVRLDDVAQAALREVAYFDIYPESDTTGFNGAWSSYPYFASGVVIVSGIEQGLFVLQPHLQTTAATPTPAPTPTPTLPADYEVSGHIRYHGSGVPVPAAGIRLLGPTPASAQTDGNGQFVVSGMGGETWEIEATKGADASEAINATDAVAALQATLGLRTLDAAGQLACDVSGNGTVNAVDAVMMLQYKVGLLQRFPTALACDSDWAFMPEPEAAPNQHLVQPQLSAASCQAGAIAWEPLMASAANQDFSAVLIGDCSGNWTPGTGTSAPGRVPEAGTPRPRSAAVSLGRTRAVPRIGTVRLPVYVRSPATFHSLDLELQYDTAHLQLVRTRRVRQARRALAAVNEQTPGRLAVSLASLAPLRRGAVLVLEFRARGGSASRPVRILSAAAGEE